MAKSVQDWQNQWQAKIKELLADEGKNKQSIDKGNKKLAKWHVKDAQPGYQNQLNRLQQNPNYTTCVQLQAEYRSTEKKLASVTRMISNANSAKIDVKENILKTSAPMHFFPLGNQKVISPELRATILLELLADYCGFAKHKKYSDPTAQPVEWPDGMKRTPLVDIEIVLEKPCPPPSSITQSFSNLLNAASTIECTAAVTTAITPYFTMGEPEHSFPDYLRIDLILSKIKLSIKNTNTKKTNESLTSLFIMIKQQTGIDYRNVSDNPELIINEHIPNYAGSMRSMNGSK